jgi:hypothetical protein
VLFTNISSSSSIIQQVRIASYALNRKYIWLRSGASGRHNSLPVVPILSQMKCLFLKTVTMFTSKTLAIMVYKTVILTFVFYGCEFFLREEEKLQVFVNKVEGKVVPVLN